MGNFQGGGNRGGGGGGFRGGNRDGGRPSFPRRSFGNDRDSGNTMFKAVCDECNKNCEVPFRPSGDKPIFCSDCFSDKRDGGRDGGNQGPRRDFGNREVRRDFRDKPTTYSSSVKITPTSDEVKKQLMEINMKLDRLVNVIEKFTKTEIETISSPKTEIDKSSTLKSVIKKIVNKKGSKKK